jgi:hypothetical protein
VIHQESSLAGFLRGRQFVEDGGWDKVLNHVEARCDDKGAVENDHKSCCSQNNNPPI